MNNNEITDPKQEVSQEKHNNAQAMNESGIDFIWGSDQDELVEEHKKEK
ncbi:hypothetical protein SAMN02799624_04084 [Paenibacillus sp. UNC496MF]|nr:hypothetical protein [Paenibacillus sp. UNC496MF]SFJ32880.1 hypothetical protein SAMN02799624_04084 [Paenibacillus sp. UNC496MF]